MNDNGETIIDEEEYELIAKLQELKGSYRSDFDQWKNLKSEINYCQNLVNQCQNRLLQGRSSFPIHSHFHSPSRIRYLVQRMLSQRKCPYRHRR